MWGVFTGHCHGALKLDRSTLLATFFKHLFNLYYLINFLADAFSHSGNENHQLHDNEMQNNVSEVEALNIHHAMLKW